MSRKMIVGYQRRKLKKGLVARALSIAAERFARLYLAWPPDLRWNHTEAASKTASPRRFHEMDARANSASRKQAVVDCIGRDMHRGRTVYGFKFAPFEIGDNLPYAVHSARAYGVEKLCRELRKYRANAATGHDFGSSAPEKIGELSPVRKTRSYFSA